MLMQQRNVEMSVYVRRKVEHLCEVWVLSSENILGCDVSMSGRAACSPMVIRGANCAAFL